MFKLQITIIFSFFLIGSVLGQQKAIDSLELVFENETDDSIKARVGVQLAVLFRDIDPVEVVKYNQYKLNYWIKNEMDGLGEGYYDLAVSYYNVGDHNEAINHYIKALDEFNKTEQFKRAAFIGQNLGDVYAELDRYDKALYFYKIAEVNRGSHQEWVGVSTLYNKMGNTYRNKKQYDSAFYYLGKALDLDLQSKDEFGLIEDYNNIGNCFMAQQKYDSALKYFLNADALLMEEQQYQKMLLLLSLGEVYFHLKSYDLAAYNTNSAMHLAEELNAIEGLSHSKKVLSNILLAKGLYDSAYYYLDAYAVLHDSIFSNNMQEQIRRVEQSYVLQKRQNEIKELTQENILAAEKDKQNTTFIYMLIGGVLLLGALVTMLVKKNRFKTRVYELLQKQRNLIIERNKEVESSIIYAKGIQEVVLPNDSSLFKNFKQNFSYYKACDIVTGDFFWVSSVNNQRILAVVDCTGHGVPGAFMTLVANALLNKTILEQGITEPAEILNALCFGLKAMVKGRKQSVMVDDGFDIAICVFSEDMKSVKFSGARRPLYIFQDRELNVHYGDKRSIGMNISEEESFPFSQTDIPLHTGDSLFLFSDGITDQFGGASNKKFMQAGLKSFIKSNIDLPIEEMGQAFEKSMHGWKKNNAQTDDMILVGLRV